MKATSKIFKALIGGGVIVLLVFTFAGQAAAQTWSQLAPTGGPPQAPGGPEVYDPVSNQAIHYGPCCAHTTEVWALANADGVSGTPQWLNIIPAGAFGPPGRHAHAVVYDPINDRMTIFSGCGGGCFPVLTDVWVLVNASGRSGTSVWSQLFPAPDPEFGAPVGRAGSVAVYDPFSNQMILFGGQNGGGFPGATFPEVWRLSRANGLGGGSAWKRVLTAGTFPPGQYFSAAAYDAPHNRMIVFGGSAQGTGLGTNAVWVLSNANGTQATTPTWINVVPEGAPGSPLAGGLRDFTTYDPVNSRLLLVDDFSGPNVLSWVLRNANGLGGPATWEQLATSGAPASLPRGLVTPVYNSASNRLTAFRGTPSGVGAEAWVLTNANGVTPASNISTVAGTGVAGFNGDNILATSAQLNFPFGVAVGGSFFIADRNNHRIRRVDSEGIITTVAGTGVAGFSGDGGPATKAQLNGPIGVALDAAGNFYIADSANYRIRKVSGGIITTVAGSGVIGFGGDEGSATAANLWNPKGVAVSGNNLYIADEMNQRIRLVNLATGVISTLAGTGVAGFNGDFVNEQPRQATTAQLNGPLGVAVDGSGNVFIADEGNDRIRKVDPKGIITTVASGLNAPSGVAVKVGDVFIANTGSNQILKLSGGTITTVAGTGVACSPTTDPCGDGGPATSARLNSPAGVAVDGAGNLFIADTLNQRIRKVGP